MKRFCAAFRRSATRSCCRRAPFPGGRRTCPCPDGDQHLADPTAYRRDRRKDLLLQENGYLVLRFLAQDVGKELDRVLDTILRALARGARVR